MLVYCFGSLYYVAAVVWLTAACVLVSVPALTKLSWDLTSPDSAMPPEVRAAVMLAADHVLAGILVSGAMWQLLSYSFAPGYLPGRRPELFVLRATSALIAACGDDIQLHDADDKQLMVLGAAMEGHPIRSMTIYGSLGVESLAKMKQVAAANGLTVHFDSSSVFFASA